MYAAERLSAHRASDVVLARYQLLTPHYLHSTQRLVSITDKLCKVNLLLNLCLLYLLMWSISAPIFNLDRYAPISQINTNANLFSCLRWFGSFLSRLYSFCLHILNKYYNTVITLINLLARLRVVTQTLTRKMTNTYIYLCSEALKGATLQIVSHYCLKYMPMTHYALTRKPFLPDRILWKTFQLVRLYIQRHYNRILFL